MLVLISYEEPRALHRAQAHPGRSWWVWARTGWLWGRVEHPSKWPRWCLHEVVGCQFLIFQLRSVTVLRSFCDLEKVKFFLSIKQTRGWLGKGNISCSSTTYDYYCNYHYDMSRVVSGPWYMLSPYLLDEWMNTNNIAECLLYAGPYLEIFTATPWGGSA